MDDAVVLEDGVDEDVGGRRRHVHDVDVDQLLVLTLYRKTLSFLSLFLSFPLFVSVSNFVCLFLIFFTFS